MLQEKKFQTLCQQIWANFLEVFFVAIIIQEVFEVYFISY